MNLNELWGHCIDGWATIQKSPTALTINLDFGYVLWTAPSIKWIQVQDVNFLRCLQTLGASSMDTSWATTGFWGAWPPFFIIPSLVFLLTFQAVLLRYFGQSLIRCSGLPHSKQLQFFLSYSPTVLAKQMIYLTNWSAPPIPLEVSESFSSEDPASSSPSGFTPESSSAECFPLWWIERWRYNCPSAS